MIQNKKHKINVENRGYRYVGTYEKQEVMIDSGLPRPVSETYMRVICPYCKKEYDTRVSGFNHGYDCKFCCNKYENSFAYHIEVELGEDINKYWDWEKNNELGLNPYMIFSGAHKKVWIKCLCIDYHGSYDIRCDRFKYHKNRCPYCSSQRIHPLDSFAQYHIDNTDKDFLEKYWDYEKNTVNPYEISPFSNKPIWIKCQEKDYHGSYKIRCSSFTNQNSRCPYCHKNSGKVHLYDSFGYNNFDKVCISWSNDNNASPFKISCHSGKKYIFYCEECDEYFKKTITKITDREQWCPYCNMSLGEKKIKYWLENNHIKYIYEKTFKNLLGIGGKGLSYDFYLPDYNLLIEYQGEQHEKAIDGFGGEKKFKTQREHDKRKREYANKNKYKLLEIWYWDFDRIEEILEDLVTNK